jgi:type I restriction enzyme S subunit
MLQPKLRFPDFKGNWEKKAFKDLVKINQGLQIPISERFLTKIENSHFYITNEFLKYGTEKQYYIKNPPESVLCDENDILMTRTGNTGLVVTNVKGAFHNNFFKIKYPSSIEKDFLFYFLILKKTQNLIKSLAGTSTIPDLNHSDFYKIQFCFPLKKEQSKIASFLSTVDEKINLLKKQLSLLEQYKKGVMQKTFSRKIRFKDEDGTEFPEWEFKKLGEIGSFQTSSIDKLSNPDEQEVYLVNYMNVYRHEELNNKTVKDFQIVTAKENQIKSCNLIKGDILFTPSSETPGDIGHSVVIFENLETAVFSYHLMRWRPIIQIDLFYSHYFCNTNQVLTQISRLATGSTRFTISVKSFSSIIVGLPVLNEQQKIASFLSSIDEKIDYKKNQIRKMESWKKGLLQQMFI